MNILIPVDTNDTEEAVIVPQSQMQFWAFIELDERQQPTISFHTSYEDVIDSTQIVVVKNPNEHVWPFLERYLTVLVAPFQRSIEDILEAYLFKELHDLSF